MSLGGLPVAGVTVGSLESGPVVGVLGIGVAVAVTSALSALFSLPIVIVLEFAGAAAAGDEEDGAERWPGRGRHASASGGGGVVVVHGRAAYRNPLNRLLWCGAAIGSTADRARRGGSGALYPQSALAGLNSPPRGSAPVAPPSGASMVRVPRGVGLRIRSGPEGSSLKRSPAGAAGAPGPEPRAAIRRRQAGSRRGVHGPLSAAPEDQPGAVGRRLGEPGRHRHRLVGIAGVEDVVRVRPPGWPGRRRPRG